METPHELAELNEKAWTMHRRDPASALEIVKAVEVRARELGDEANLAMALRTIGAAHFQSGELKDAGVSLNEAADLLVGLTSQEPGSGDSALLSARGETARHLARMAFMRGEYEKCLRSINDASDAFQAAGDKQGLARANNDAGTLHAHLGAYQQGLEFLLSSLRLLEEEGIAVAGGPLNNIGNIYMIQGDPEQALIFFERAIQVFESEGGARDQVIGLGNIARACQALGQLDRAIELHDRAVAMARELKDTAYLPATLGKYGTALGRAKRYEEALAAFDEALALFDEIDAPFKDEVLLSLSELLLGMGRATDAEPLLVETMKLASESGNKPILSSAHEGLAQSLEERGRFQEALEHFREFHRIDVNLKEELFSSRTQVLLLQHELNQSRREGELLRSMNAQLNSAFGELQVLHKELERKSSELETLSMTDPLTKLSNRRQLDLCLQEEIARLQRNAGVFSVIMADIDDFKAINDSFTHAKGDEILVEFARLLRENTRTADTVARIGGEEFVLILPQASLEDALAVAEKLRATVESHDWGRLQPGLRVTISAGVSEARSGDLGNEVLRDADRGLYRAKHMGKNTVCWEYDRVTDPG